MRRLSVALALSALVPAAILVAMSPASAATSSLIVTTLGRDGSKVTTTVSVNEFNSTRTYTIASGKALTLPSGKYDVLVDVWNSKDDTDTVGGKIVTVSGATTTTIDARLGKPLKVTLDPDPGPGYTQQLWANVCGADLNWVGDAEAYNAPGHVYVIPNSDKNLSFAYMSVWSPNSGPAAPSYDVVGLSTGLPSTAGGAFHQASLATVSVQDRKGPSIGTQSDVSLTPQPADGGVSCASDLFHVSYDGETPFSVTTLVSPGSWDVRSDDYAAHLGQTWDVGAWFDQQTLTAGQVYSHVFNHSAFGPTHNLPIILSKTLNFDISSMFGDPYVADRGFDGSVKATAALSLGGATLSSQSLSTYGDSSSSIFTKKLTVAGWYTLSVSATHYYPDVTLPAAMLSPTSAASFHFYADPAAGSVVAPVFVTRFLPLSLNSSNEAAPNSTTSVQLKLDRTAQDPDATFHSDTAKTVVAWASYDSGKTWHSVTVTHSGTAWTAAVANPASGTVSLRDTVTDAKGNSSTVTVIKAYAIG